MAGPIAPRDRRLGAFCIDLLIHGILLIPVVMISPEPGYRPVTLVALWWTFIVAYETVMVRAAGGTVGKLLTGIRVVALDRNGPVPIVSALRRAAIATVLELVPFIGWTVLGGTLTDALGRGSPDRAADTIVIRRDAGRPVRHRDLPGLADHLSPPRLGPYGRIGDLDVRIRARLRRLHASPILVVLTAVSALIAAHPSAGVGAILGMALLWILVFVVDETVRIHRRGATPGHEMAGLVVHAPRNGAAPSIPRSLVRAIVFAATAYTIIGVPLLLVSMLLIRWSPTGRSLHDRIAGTWVIADPRLDPEVARQRAMRMRTGEVA